MQLSNAKDGIDPLLPADQVRMMFGGVSAMWLHRRLRDSDFPKPIYIGGLRYWRCSEIEAWAAAQPRENPARRGVGKAAVA
jgi:predicted DNA-binding transcriptional regulator AlpA